MEYPDNKVDNEDSQPDEQLESQMNIVVPDTLAGQSGSASPAASATQAAPANAVHNAPHNSAHSSRISHSASKTHKSRKGKEARTAAGESDSASPSSFRKNSTQSTVMLLSIASALLLALLIISIITGGFGTGTGVSSGKALSADQVKTKATEYLSQTLPGQTVEITSIEDQGSVYAIKLSVNGQSYDSFASKDGSLLFPGAMNLDEAPAAQPAQAQQAQAPPVVPKSDKPAVELFVMSHCPYGTQVEKGILPAVKALGDKVDFKVRFVYYAMHGPTEVNEQLRQYCIQKEQPDAYLKYLACFLNASDSPGCLASTGVDSAKLDACTVAADSEFQVTANLNDQSKWLSGRYPMFNTDAEANQKYGVGGSPTLVINGQQADSGRDSASLLSAICAGFNDAPSECQTQLSAVSPGPGFGYDSVGQAVAAGCGV